MISVSMYGIVMFFCVPSNRDDIRPCFPVATDIDATSLSKLKPLLGRWQSRLTNLDRCRAVAVDLAVVSAEIHLKVGSLNPSHAAALERKRESHS